MARKQRSDTEKRKANSLKDPRKCDTCDYVSNNPSMFHYHKKTHSSLDNKFCRCGNVATHVGTMGKYRCNQNPHLCPLYLEEHSARIKEQWIGDEARREDTITSLPTAYPLEKYLVNLRIYLFHMSTQKNTEK